MKTETLNSMKERRSVRSYKPEQIREEELNAVLESGAYAASGRGMQSAKFVVVQDKETRDLLSKWNAEVLGVDTDPFYGAPTIIVVFADTNRSTYLEDGALAIGNMMLGAYAVGLGSCWIHRAKEVFSSAKGKELMKKWGVSDNYVGVGHCALGYAAGPLPEAAPRKPENIVRV
ncbi:MAG: nitroreductase [Thermoguttaceae bacterium]|nr:nitroreductase [Thermoguttaceae bacterium]MBQ2039365.1 nitroreductase [Thermoguttaceae bacterium]MBQ2556902.1 nitroreductase [Thermoguttaceae bacterium]MBQ3822978.1 nitroreductase [Thermoguttaceae bacterium]MBQ4203732.1 nitroreductase [Thermoguttaceae bacterium]